MPEIKTIADFWDREIECSERGQKWVSDHLLYIVRRSWGRFNLRNLDVEQALRDMALEQAVSWEWEVGDRVLDFADGSRLALVAMDAGTMAGSSRVMEPGEGGVRRVVRGGRPYVHGRTKTAWYWTKSSGVDRELLWEVTGEACPKDGVWVRRFCNLGCGDREVWMERMSAGAVLPRCVNCKSRANFGWATP